MNGKVGRPHGFAACLNRKFHHGPSESTAIARALNRDAAVFCAAIGLSLLIATLLIFSPFDDRAVWPHSIMLPSATILIWLCTRRWGRWPDAIGLRPPSSYGWIAVGAVLGPLLTWILLPLWQVLIAPSYSELPAFYAGPVWEEVIFRGLFCSAAFAAIARRQPRSRTFLVCSGSALVVLSAFVFSLSHQLLTGTAPWWSRVMIAEFADRALCGAVFAMVCLRSESLLPSIVAHASTNLAVSMQLVSGLKLR
ncbi:MAG: CPBP family intramembrane metalloprotease [Chloroflexi bacterium]|nr:CPBP family intramembrane metalloprotease [Chloroflexota bacterium]